MSRRKFTKEIKLAAIQQLERGSSAAEVARAFEVNPNVLHRWRKEFRHGPANAFPGEGKRRWEEPKIAQLERKVGQQALEIDFLKGACSESRSSGCCRHSLETATYKHIRSEIEKGCAMTIEEMCELGKVSRAGLYRFEPKAGQRDDDLDLRNEIQRIALEFPCYGRPRITAELKRRG